ncbi:MAG: TPM domain-containing protein [Oscillospiraceae bacterium]|nr:TPM domain-containing protein [Oscillospiraceae bacterium]
MKRTISFLLLLLCLSLLAAPFASAVMPMVTDDASLLSDGERSSLEAMLQQLSDTYSVQIAVVTTDSAEGYNMDSLVEYIYDTYDYGYGTGNDGVLLLIAMDVREFRILSNGFAGDAIGAYEIDAISEAITPDLSAGFYADAFETFAEECEYYLEGYLYGYSFDFSTNLLIAVVIGVVISLIVVLIMKGQLKSVKLQKHANSYVRSGSFNLTQSGDYFMYRNISRTPRPQDNSSGGGSRSGGGGSRHVGGGRF